MKMMYIVSFLLIFSFESVTCLRIITRDRIAIRYTIDYESKCQSPVDRFFFLHGISIAQCLLECRLRKHCGALNFWTSISVCELFQDSVEGDIKDGKCLHVFSKDIQMDESLCGECQFGKVCDVTSRTCVTKECPKDHLPGNGKHLGNMYSVGATVLYFCEEGYEVSKGVLKGKAMCMDNGDWNASGCQKVSCGMPKIENARVVLDKPPNGTLYTDNATVTCDAWYQTRKTKIRCLKSGEWETTSCQDCYLISPSKYDGKRNTTVTGKPCLRWDSPDITQYGFTNLTFFPDATLSNAENYCRSPTSDFYEPWCFTTNLSDYEYCDVKECDYY